MFMLTRKNCTTVIPSLSLVVQFFVNKDDAMCYNEQLKACDYDLEVTEVPDESVEKLCDALGYAYTVAEPGELIMPRMEILETLLDDL